MRKDCEALAGKSTLNRLEHTPRRHASKYHKIDCDDAQVDALLVDLFLEAHERAPREIVLDLDNTDIPLHGEQEGRFFHGYYKEYCYLPLYVFCGRHLLLARQRCANVAGSAGAVAPWAWLVPLALLGLVYPWRAWRDDPVRQSADRNRRRLHAAQRESLREHQGDSLTDIRVGGARAGASPPRIAQSTPCSPTPSTPATPGAASPLRWC